MGAGPGDAPYVDSALADKGKSVWAAECINCHGTQARGTDNGPNLTRSLVVLRDRYGSELGPFLKKGHKLQSGGSAAALTDDQVVNLAHFLRQRVNDSFRGSPLFQAQNVLTGDAKAGEAYYNGEGKCATCHSGDQFTDANQRLHAVSDVVSEPEAAGVPSYASRSATRTYRTSPLRGIWQHAPYFHNGSAATLEDVVSAYDKRKSLGLTAQQSGDLAQYLKSL